MPSLLLTSIWQTLGTEHLLWSQFPSAPQASGSVIESFTCVSFVVIRTATYFPRDATDAPQDACVSQCGESVPSSCQPPCVPTRVSHWRRQESYLSTFGPLMGEEGNTLARVLHLWKR
ncbi:hypothetical protein EDB84DRAFT_1451912 [Lactarius hengduanensis]|nr:hypothetical protein EDB84DRAFT_1451912 [Lactarius hengduanensis]